MKYKNFWKVLILVVFTSAICYLSFQKKYIITEYNHQLGYLLQNISSSIDKYRCSIEVVDPSLSFRSSYRNGLKNQPGRNCNDYTACISIKNYLLTTDLKNWKDGTHALPIYLSANQLLI